MNIHTNEAEYLKTEVQRIIALVRAQQITIDKLEQALAAPMQEPAFHGFMDKEQCCVNICYTPWAPGGPNNELPTAYYTTPPAAQRQAAPDPKDRRSAWVGLTTEEIYACDETSGLPQHEITNADLQAFAYAIEAKLKEKNT